jgi:hypothetical protein
LDGVAPVVVDELELELGGAVVVEEVEELVLVLELVGAVGSGGGVVSVVLGEGVVAGGQDSETDFAGAGRFSDDTGAPGASWKYSVWPLTRTTVTVQSAAEAEGSTATPDVANTTAAVTAATFSFERLSTSALSPPALRRAAFVRAKRACEASY